MKSEEISSSRIPSRGAEQALVVVIANASDTEVQFEGRRFGTAVSDPNYSSGAMRNSRCKWARFLA